MDALASWNCRLLLYTIVAVHDIETGLSTQILRYFSKANEQTSNYNPMCFYAVCYSLARNISGIC